MTIEEALKKARQFNPGKLLVVRADGRIEVKCEHGVGHTVYSPTDDYVHGCDGCCSKYTIIPKEID